MNIKAFKAVLSIFIFTASLAADIDVRKELENIVEEKSEDWLSDGCDESLYSLIGLKIQIAYIEKYSREIKAQQTYAFCGDTQMASTFTPTDEVLHEFIGDVLLDFNNAIPKDVASCGSNRNVEKRIKELIFEPHAFKAFMLGTYNHLKGLSLSYQSSAIDMPISANGEIVKACKAVYKNPEYTMPPSWLD